MTMATYTVEFDPQHNQALLAGSSMVFHCHYYNCAIHKSIEMALPNDAADLFRRAAYASVQPQLINLMGQADGPTTRIERGLELFKQLGFGSFEPQALSATGGTVTSTSSHYALGWIAHHGLRETPVCQFMEGYLQALVVVAYGLNEHQVTVKEMECLAKGDPACTFVVNIEPEMSQAIDQEVSRGN